MWQGNKEIYDLRLSCRRHKEGSRNQARSYRLKSWSAVFHVHPAFLRSDMLSIEDVSNIELDFDPVPQTEIFGLSERISPL